jgi:ligand-binding sensor domain-containing protein
VGKTSKRVGSTRVTDSQLCRLVLLLIVSCGSLLVAPTLRAANLQIGHESWTFKDGAPPDVVCLAQTHDGFLWLCAPNGLLKFDGTRFEPFRSPFRDRLLSTNLYSLFAPPSGGLWVGYTLGGISFVDNGRVTNYAHVTGSVRGFAQDRNRMGCHGQWSVEI